MKTEKRVMLHTRLPQVLARPVAHHVETDQVFYVVILKYRHVSLKSSFLPTLIIINYSKDVMMDLIVQLSVSHLKMHLEFHVQQEVILCVLN